MHRKYNAPNMRLGVLIDSSKEELVIGYDSAPN